MFRCPSRSMVMKRLDGDFDNMWRRSTPCLWIGCSTMDSLKVILHRFHGSVRLLLPMVSPSRRMQGSNTRADYRPDLNQGDGEGDESLGSFEHVEDV